MSGGERQKTSVIFFFFFPSIFSRRKKCLRVGESIVIQRARAPDMAESGSAFFIIFLFFPPCV
jgi:hypothetical protein